MSSPAESPGAKEAAFHIPSLDGIRAISFLIVFVAHAGLNRLVPGYFGLSLFFFLSGFLITTLLRVEFETTGGISLRQFYLRRVLRIFPPFYLILFAAGILTMTGFFVEGSITLTAALAQALHVTNYYVIIRGWWVGMAPGTSIYWSLAVEEHFSDISLALPRAASARHDRQPHGHHAGDMVCAGSSVAVWAGLSPARHSRAHLPWQRHEGRLDPRRLHPRGVA